MTSTTLSGNFYPNGIPLIIGPFNPLIFTGTVDVYGYVGIYGASGTVWTITNQGTVESAGPGGFGIKLQSGGWVSNTSTGLITSAEDAAIYVAGGQATVLNTGLITTTGGVRSGIGAHYGGYVSNA